MNHMIRWITGLKKDCPTCTGTGNIACKCNENNEISCPNCNGTGVVSRQVTTTQKIEQPCDHPQCQQGKVRCGVCNGLGTDGQGQPCKACHGSGTINCPVCGGLGRISRSKQESWLQNETCHVCNGRGMVDCYLCHGKKERVCPTCKGKGTVIDTGKLIVLATMTVLLLAMPMLAIAVALIMLGRMVFPLLQDWKHKESGEATEQTWEEQSEESMQEPTE